MALHLRGDIERVHVGKTPKMAMGSEVALEVKSWWRQTGQSKGLAGGRKELGMFKKGEVHRYSGRPALGVGAQEEGRFQGQAQEAQEANPTGSRGAGRGAGRPRCPGAAGTGPRGAGTAECVCPAEAEPLGRGEGGKEPPGREVLAAEDSVCTPVT